MIVPGILVCRSFLISVCMFIVSKALFISSATVIVRAGLYEVPLSMSLLFFGGDGDYVSQLSYVWYYVGVKSSFQHAREECESNRAGPMCFRCLIFSLSGPCGLLFLLSFIAILLLNVMEVFSVSGGGLLDGPCLVCQRMCMLCL